MEQPGPVQQFQQQQSPAPVLISNMQGHALQQQHQHPNVHVNSTPAILQHVPAMHRPALASPSLGAMPAGLPQAIGGGPGMPHSQLPMPTPAITARPQGVVGMPAPTGLTQQAPRPVAATHTLPGHPSQIPPAMLPLLGYPLPLLQSVQNVSVEELSKHTGIPLALLQAQPQMQLAARQIMLQRIMAFQFQAQQAQQQQQQRPVAVPQQVIQQRVAPATVKPKAPIKSKLQPKQPKAATPSMQRQQQQQPASSEGAVGGGEIGGKVIWAKLGSYPWWPAKTLSDGDPSFPPDADPPRPTSIPIRFFGTYEFCWMGSKRAIADWEEAYGEHVRGCDQDSFRIAVEEVEHYKRTGELPQVFYMRPPPQGRFKARGKRRVRPRSAHTPGTAGTMSGGEDALGTPTAMAGGARLRPGSKTPQAVENRTSLARARRKRLLKELGLAPPEDSPYANGRICPNPGLLKLQPSFDEQWPPSSRPAKALLPASIPLQAQSGTAQPPAGAPGNLGPAAALAASLGGQSSLQSLAAVHSQLVQQSGAAASQLPQPQVLAAAHTLPASLAPAQPALEASHPSYGPAVMPATGIAAAAPPSQQPYAGQHVPPQPLQQPSLPQLQSLTVQQVGVMAGGLPQAAVQQQ